MARIFLVAISLLYFGLALWCTIQPSVTSAKVGFELKGGTGQSEFMTVYGGLEFGIALMLLAAAFRSDTVAFGVLACTLIHGSLVLFRTLSFLCYSDIDPFTYKLAAGEWVISLLGATLIFFQSRHP